MLCLRLAIVVLYIPLLLAGCFSSTRKGGEAPPLPPLIKAAEKGDIVAIRAMLARGTDIQVRDGRARTALMYAAANGDTVIMQTLLVSGAEVNARDALGWTALMLAAGSGDNGAVQTLLAYKPHVNAKTNNGWTALMHATARGHVAIVQSLLSNGAEANAKDRDEQTALLLAVQGGHTAIVQALLASGADPQMQNREGKTPLTIAESEGFSNIAQLLKHAIERGQAVDKPVPPAGSSEGSGREPRPQRQVTDLPSATGTAAQDSSREPSSQAAAQPPAPGDTPPSVSTASPTPPPSVSPQSAPTAPADPLVTRQARTDFGRYEALVIGVNNYTNLRPLQTAVNDAIAVAQLLGNMYGFTVTLLTNATRAEIISALDNLRRRLDERDNLLIYYAGHGVLDTGEGRGYWLPVNARQDSRVHWLSNTTITDALKAMPARHVLVVADSCYAGTLMRGIEVVEQQRHSDREAYVVRLMEKRSRTVLTSGGLEPVLDSGGGQHSVFAKAFLTVLQENTDILEGQQLFSALRRPVVVNAAQTPEYSDLRYAGHEGGDFLFVRR
jgi:ankyrin repeat protein